MAYVHMAYLDMAYVHMAHLAALRNPHAVPQLHACTNPEALSYTSNLDSSSSIPHPHTRDP
jgi:hypothetical protein